MTNIHSAAVLGAGTMGAQIAAHLANVGIPVWLLDLDTKTAEAGLKRIQKLKPNPFFEPEGLKLISLGGFETDMPKLSECDWIIEAVVEQLDVKNDLMAKVEQYLGAETIISSNTSGIPIVSIAEGRSDQFRRNWLGTHFFNPPRYLHLMEVIPTKDTDQKIVEKITKFAESNLGKGVVVAKDTPGFIGNRIGIFGVMRALELLTKGNFTIEEIDAITGTAIGRAKSATFRTMDITGIDILANVSGDLARRLENNEERTWFALPDLIVRLIELGAIGEKSGRGFYKKEKRPSGSRILTLDPKTLDYRERQEPKLQELDEAASVSDVGERVKTLFTGKNRVGQFLRSTLGSTLLYAAKVTPFIANSVDDVDRAMRWGYGWDLGPFELWDAIGIETVLEACEVTDVPPLVRDLSTRKLNGTSSVSKRFRSGYVLPAGPDLQILRTAKEQRSVVRHNDGASLIDLGDGILAVEFHSKMNSIGASTIEMLQLAVSEAEQNFDGIVIGNDGKNFSAGANLLMILLNAQEENWEELDIMIRRFQSSVIGLRRCSVPVVVAPAGLTLGGGCEICLHGDEVQAAAETYMGQVEVGVGLLPAGGGTKELLIRATDSMPIASDPLPYVRHVFELIGFGKVSTSAPNAKRLGFLRDIDGYTMNKERLLADAKDRALRMVKKGYQPSQPRYDIMVGGDGIRVALDLDVHLAWRAGYISEHDVLIGQKISHVLSGGALPHAIKVSENHLLDLEREGFLSLCGEPKTRERISHTLKTGKTLRN